MQAHYVPPCRRSTPASPFTAAKRPPYGQLVRVHYNLHAARKRAPAWVVTQHNRVVCYLNSCTLADARPVVLPGGARRSLQIGRRTVHAYLAGVLGKSAGSVQGMARIRYALPPVARFECDGAPLVDGTHIVLLPDGSAWRAS